MKNYYEILEVDKNASKEIIDKAFKVLAKKYHPDIHEEEKKAWAEAKFKEINEAYEVLSNKITKEEYDVNLKNNEIDKYEALLIQKQHLENIVSQLKLELQISKNSSNNSNYNESIPYTNNTIKSDGDFIEEKYFYYKPFIRHRFKDLLAFLITFLFIFFIGFIIWNIPFTNKFLINLYENNAPIKLIIDTIFNFFD